MVLLIFLTKENFQQQKKLHFSLIFKKNLKCEKFKLFVISFGCLEGNGKGEDEDEQR